MRPEEFQYVRNLVHAAAGIVLDAGKEYLVQTRLRPLAEEAGAASVQEFIRRLRDSISNGMHRRVVEAITTNETFFFRDTHAFESLRNVILPALMERRRAERGLTIWSAACSTGQEPYSIALILREHFPQLASWTCRILATDLNLEVLAQARAGRYSQLEVNRGLPAQLLAKYFSRNKLSWEIKEEIRRMVEFSELNLTNPWGPLPKMDIILLRNVLIYFDIQTKRRILNWMRIRLRPDGYLLLGGSEAVLGLSDSFQRVPNDRSGWHVLLNERSAQ